jgi:hypothetical protein
MLAEVENSGNRKAIKREAWEFLKYKDLTAGIQCM